MVQAFVSRDGTAIAYERTGRGPALVVVNGALADRTASRSLVPALESVFTVYAYDRRGRGSSGDAPGWSIDREIEDLDGLLEIIGAPVFLYGHSSGAVLALEATLRGLEVERLALHEPPFIVPGTRPAPPTDLAARLTALIGAGEQAQAVLAFYREGVGVPEWMLDRVAASAGFPSACAMAATLPYDTAIVGQGRIPYRRLAIETPTLVLTGTASPAWMRRSNQALADALPRGRLVALAGQEHDAAADLVAAELGRFFGEDAPAAVAV